MTTTTTTGQARNISAKNGDNGANAEAKAKTMLEVTKKKKRMQNKLKKQRNTE